MSAPVGSSVTRTFPAPPEAVFDAWVTPSSFTIWWGGSGIEVPLDSLAMDVRPGGAWQATMILGHDMPDVHWRGEFVDVDRPRRLSMTMTDEPGDARELLSATFTAVEDGTEMVFSQTGGHLSPEQYDAATAGWQTAFDTLDMMLVS